MPTVPPRLLADLQEGLRLLDQGAAMVRGAVAVLAVVVAQQEPADSADEWLTPKLAAQRLAVSVKWLSRRRRTLPFVHPMPGAGFRVNVREMDAWLKARRG